MIDKCGYCHKPFNECSAWKFEQAWLREGEFWESING